MTSREGQVGDQVGNETRNEDAGPKDQSTGRADEVPESVLASAKDAFSSRVGGELAPLVFDSLVDADDDAAFHSLRFEHARVHIELSVSEIDRGTAIVGEVRPAGKDSAGGVTVDQAVMHFQSADVARVSAVQSGRFSFPPIAHGLVRISLEGGSEPAIHTDWFRV
jgi:hypothetical protein